MLSELRQSISKRLSSARFAHTLSVEREARRMAEILLPHKTLELCAAALLHDLTKEMSLDDHLEIMQRHRVTCSDEARLGGAVLHGFTAAAVISEQFPLFAREEILSAVRKHTVGDYEMSVFDKILFLADYIEQTRTYPDCVSLRESFWSRITSIGKEEREAALNSAVYTEIRQTISHLLKKGAVIAPESLALYNRMSRCKDWQG